MPDARVTLRRKSPYCTRSNRFKKIRTPGGKLTIQYVKKRGSVPKCGDTGAPLFGVAVRRPKELMRLSKPKKTVSRCYGGALSGKAVRNRYVFIAYFLRSLSISALHPDVFVLVSSNHTGSEDTSAPALILLHVMIMADSLEHMGTSCPLSRSRDAHISHH